MSLGKDSLVVNNRHLVKLAYAQSFEEFKDHSEVWPVRMGRRNQKSAENERGILLSLWSLPLPGHWCQSPALIWCFAFLCSLQDNLCLIFVVVQLPSHVRLFEIPWTAARQASLSLTIFQTLLKFISIGIWILSTGKIIALTIQTSVSKAFSLFFNMLSGFVTGFP